MSIKKALILILMVLLSACAVWGYISSEEAKKISVGDMVYVKLGDAIDGNGIIKTYDKSTGMTTIEMKDKKGNNIVLNVHYGWIGAIVNDIPEIADPLIDLKQQIINLQTENNSLKQTINTQKIYIDKTSSDMKSIANIVGTYK